MKSPKKPPFELNFFDHLEQYKDNGDKITQLMSLSSTIAEGKVYYHWDQLRFRPLPEGLGDLSHEDYWFALKFQRIAQTKRLSFKSTKHQPFIFTRPDCLLSKLRIIDVKAGGAVSTDHEAIVKTDGERFLRRSVIEEPFSSSVLEGALTTRERAKAMIEKNDTPLNEGEQMVLNNYNAMMFIKEHIHEDLTPAIILECHKIITENTLDRPEMAGCLRDNNDIIVGDDYGEIFHEPPDYNELSARLDILCKFANQRESEADYFIHPITRAIILHFMLAYDHPFIDGNGRTARALFYWSVLKSGYWIMEYISISMIIKRAPVRYGKAFLYTETDFNDVTYFIMHQLDVILKSIAELEAYLARQKKNYNAAEKLLADKSLNERQANLLSNFIRRKLDKITIIEHEKNHRISYLTARKDLNRLIESKWLKAKTQGRTIFFTPSKKLKAFYDR